jgi:ferredoxin
MRVTLDDDQCRGHAVYCSLCPSVFTLNDDGYTEVTQPEVPAELRPAVLKAAESCPERAISVTMGA